jgi:hypothetical protein
MRDEVSISGVVLGNFDPDFEIIIADNQPDLIHGEAVTFVGIDGSDLVPC